MSRFDNLWGHEPMRPELVVRVKPSWWDRARLWLRSIKWTCPICGSRKRNVCLVYYNPTNRSSHPSSCYDPWHSAQPWPQIRAWFRGD